MMTSNPHRWKSALLAGGFIAALAAAPAARAQDQTPTPDTPTEPVPGNPTPPLPPEPPTPPVPPNPPTPEDRGMVTGATSEPEHPRLRIGPEFGVFLPSDSKTKDRFGSTWAGIGIGFGSVEQNGLLGRTSGEIYLLSHRSHGNKAYVLPVGIAYRRDLSGGTGARPYVGASVNAIFTDYKSEEDNLPFKIRTGAGASAIAGVAFSPRGYIEARYLVTSKIKDFNFSGLSLTAGVRF